MDVVIFILLFIVLAIVLSFKSTMNSRLDALSNDLFAIKEQLKKLGNVVNTPKVKADIWPEIVPIIKPIEPKKEDSSTYGETGFKVVEKEEPKPIIVSKSIAADRPVRADEFVAELRLKEASNTPKPVSVTPVERGVSPSFFERNPDLEKFIGENLISKIGIAILVLAIGFFVKYAIDNNWIGPVGRVAIGILCGGILVGIAHKLQASYKSFSSVLVGGGLAIFYFTITLGYHQFHLFSQTLAFIIMIVITAFAVVLSLLYNRQELAIIALVGGFASPFMVSNGSGNYQTLFTYLIVLNAGLLIIAYNKSWRLLNFIAFVFTIVLFGSWILTLNETVAKTTYVGGFVFATIFYLMFFAINVAYNIKENKKFIVSDFGILLASTSLYFATGLYCLSSMLADEYRGLFTMSLGAFNLVASYVLFKNKKVDANILYLLIGLTLTFISLTAPIQLHGNFITLFWASEAVLLLWLYQRSRISIIELSSNIVWIAMLVSLLIDWVNIYGGNSVALNIIFNKAFITTAYSAVATYLVYWLQLKDVGSNEKSINIIQSKMVFRISAIVLLFAAGALEINYQFIHHYPATNFNVLYLIAYTYAFVHAILFVGKLLALVKFDNAVSLGSKGACVAIYICTIFSSYTIQEDLLMNKTLTNLHFMAHWFSAIAIAAMLYSIIQQLRKMLPKITEMHTVITSFVCVICVTFVSVEISLIVNEIFYSYGINLAEIERVYVKTGLPVLWGICSFIFMWLGMRYRYKTLRILSLLLFAITLFKLFVFDISNIPPTGKIAAFFSLGVLLLIVSFMYQKLKKIIIEDEEKTLL
ncbi:MAG: DUF2339 domain-containing protein [Flavobacterium sp.]|nr:DUF2339 domain-containing protein [Flavobacterium sp.]